MADQEEIASSQSIRRSTRTIRRPPRYTEAEEDSAVEGALVLTIEDPCQGGGHNASLAEEVIENHERVNIIQEENANIVDEQVPQSQEDRVRWGDFIGVREIRREVVKVYHQITTT